MIRGASASRRNLLNAAAGGILANACGSTRRRQSRLNYLLRGEPVSLDPALAPGGTDAWILTALFEPLLQPHPQSMAPMAGLATHYTIDRDATRYTFYLRGHPSPAGTRLASPDSLPAEFTRGLKAAPPERAARWSDGVVITAHDIVYSWRRYVAPDTACPNAYLFYCVSGAEAVNQRRIPPEELGVRAPDSFTFEVNLTAPAPHFLMLCYTTLTLPMPRHAIDAARKQGREEDWTRPGQMVTSGPFTLKESRVREGTVLQQNPLYFDSVFAGVDEIQFSVADGATVVNLFRTGMADSMDGRVLPLQLTPALKGTLEFRTSPACASHNWRINTTRAPLDNVLLRYALNMATDKSATVRFLGAGQQPAKWRVPSLQPYVSPHKLEVEINGRLCDVMAYDPAIARELWAAAAGPGAKQPLTVHYFARTDSQHLAEILQHQWRENLGLETRMAPQEYAAYVKAIMNGNDWAGVAEDSYFASFPDPYDLLSLYIAPYPSWSDPDYDRALTEASATADPLIRLEKLSRCEERLLLAMPFIPLYFDTWVYLERRQVHGLHVSPIGVPAFKYTWMDADAMKI